MKFDYDAPDVDVTPVVDAIRAHYRLPELSEEEKAARQIDNEIRREEQAWRAEERRAERERREQEAQAIARHEAAVALAEANRQARLERQKRDLEQKRDLRLGSLEIRAKQGEIFQNHVEASARNAVFLRNQAALLSDVESFLTPAAPPREPEPIAVDVDDNLGSPNISDPDFNPKYWLQKPIFRR